jgi:hypothetical protein
LKTFRISQQLHIEEENTRSYNVYLITSSGLPLDHHSIFIETHESGPKTGCIYQVTGNIQTGMVHGHRKSDIPEDMPDLRE